MKAIRIIPGQRAEDIEVENTVEALQEVVGGYLDRKYLPVTNAMLLCDEDGRMKELDYNFRLMGDDYVGTAVIVGIDGENWCDVPITAERFEKYWLGR